MKKKEPKFLEEFKYLWHEDIESARELIVDGYWHLKKYRSQFKEKEEDFDHVNKIAKNMIEPLKALVEIAGISGMDEIGVRPYAKKIVSVIDIHLKRCNEYRKHSWSKPRSFRSKPDQKSEGAFQQTKVIPESRKIREALQKLNIESDQSRVDIEFEANQVASIPMREILCERSQKIKKKVDSLKMDWDIILDNGIYINMKKSDILEYKPDRHFWDQDKDTLEFWVSEYNKCRYGYEIDGYKMTGSMYFQINFFKTPIKDLGNKITNAFLRDNEWYIDEILKYAEVQAKDLKEAGVLIGGTRRFSKALKDSEPIYYEDGQKPIGDAKVGDKIYGADGKLTTIKGVYPQGKVQLYKVTFADGRSVECCDEHLWRVFDRQSRYWKTLPLKEIIERGYIFDRVYNKRKGKIAKVPNYSIPISSPILYDKKELEIEPYLLGLWLGDGHSAGPMITTMDQPIVSYLEGYAKENNLLFKKRKNTNCGKADIYSLYTKKTTNNPILTSLRKLNLIKNKHIPEEYFYGSYEQRLFLLQGLMDTDGTIGKTGGGINIVSANEVLAKDILRLCRTLGISSFIKKEQGKYVKKDGDLNTYWRVTIFTQEKVFRLSRKFDRIDKNPNAGREGRINRVNIVNIEKTTIEEATCIRVDNKDKLFLTKDCLVTHNTTSEVSHTHRGIIVYPTETGTVISSNKEDLDSLVDKLKKTLDYIVPAFKLNILSGKSFDTKHPVIFGLKSSNGRESYEQFTLRIINTEGGSAAGNKKTAGGNPKIFVSDEVFKSSFINMYKAAIPSFESSSGWACIPLFTGTGDVSDISPDAEKALNNPTNYGFLEGVWDILEYKIPKEAITWQRRVFGWFMPAQMSIYTGMKKIKTNLADFLDIESEELKKIVFYQTDWIHNSNYIREKRKTLKGDALLAEKIYRPIDPDECFLSMKSNPYPANEIKVYQTRLKLEGTEEYGTAKRIDLHRDSEGKVYHTLSQKEVATYPHTGGFTDAPFLLFGEFPEEPPKDSYRFVAGLDDYRKEDTSGDSVASFVIFDRLTRKIVLTLANRPNPHARLHEQIHLALDAFNCKVFPEAVDMAIKTYFDRKRLADKYLARGFDALADLSAFSNAKTKYGWNPNKNTTPLVRAQVIDYVNHLFDIEDEHGNVLKTTRGFEAIEDIQILEELIKYRENGNFDRLVALGSALIYDYYLTAKHFMPLRFRKKEEDEEQYKQKKPTRRNKFFSKGRGFKW